MSDLTGASLVVGARFENVYIEQNNNQEHRLKLSANIFKHKCHKSLKKKLKKYKIRKNGEEDPDVLDVSKSLLSSLIIKSPDSKNSPCNKSDVSENIQPNYLFKTMGKRRKCNILTESNREIADDQMKPDILASLIPSDSQDKTHTNAFKLMMDSRHKSIGSNSPGKDKPLDDAESQEVLEKKEIKAKRKLSLQKMAEAKGSLKKQELEEHRDRQINKQMLKRGERFKDMITQDNAAAKSSKHNTHVKEPSPKNVAKVTNNLEHRIDIKKTLQLCNMFDPANGETNIKKVKVKNIPSEDEEFLNKLSPSIRKKENMMSYFKKVTKDDEEDDTVPSDDSSQNIIKVKFTPKHKKKKTKKNSDLKSAVTDFSTHHHSSDKNLSDHDLAKTPTKCENYQMQPLNNTSDSMSCSTTNKPEGQNDQSRPKRIPKRPAKYIENVEVFSSDEEHIFTPKKKKNLDTHNSIKIEENQIEKTNSNAKDKKLQGSMVEKFKKLSDNLKHKDKNNRDKIDSSKQKDNSKREIKSKNVKSPGNPIKLAPIFVSKQSSNVSSAEKDAKLKFLQSGIPEKLKKKDSHQQNIPTIDFFHHVVHVQQITKLSSDSSVCFKNIIFDELETEGINHTLNNSIYKNLLNLNKKDAFGISSTKKSKEELLQNIKKSYKKFPVYRTYHLLKGKSRGEFRDFNYPDLDNSIEIVNGLSSNDTDYTAKLCWVDKYKPNSTKQIIGNFTAVEELKKWLQSWTENLVKTRSGKLSEGSDFSDFVDSDADSCDAIKNSNSVLIISGEAGSGKTSSVYAVATDLSIKVIEVNASSKRTGKIMLQDLQEATRSHKVDRGKSGSECSQNIQEILKTKATHKKRGRPKKNKEVSQKNYISTSQKSEPVETPLSQENVRTDMSLILIDDADIVFDQDDGFCSAISQLIQSSKRPVILVTSSLSCPHLQKFIQYGKIINMHRFLPRMLGVWLDIMCLADVGTCFSGLGNQLLDYCKGDIRKTINMLQYYMTLFKHFTKNESVSLEDGQSQELDRHKLNIDDECSSMSWTDREYVHENNEAPLGFTSDVSKNVIRQHINMILNNLPLNLSSLWWSLPKILNYDNLSNQDDNGRQKSSSHQMFTLSNMLDIVSEADFLTGNISDGNNITNALWGSKESASVVESDNLDNYDWSKEVRNDITSELAMSGLSYSHKELKCETSLDISIPGCNVQRERDKVVGRHHILTNYLNPGVVLDRKALALDYWSSCRTICRLEMNKNDVNTKRNNRFCHYLKTLNVLCKNDYFDALSNSLNTFNNTGKLLKNNYD